MLKRYFALNFARLAAELRQRRAAAFASLWKVIGPRLSVFGDSDRKTAITSVAAVLLVHLLLIGVIALGLKSAPPGRGVEVHLTLARIKSAEPTQAPIVPANVTLLVQVPNIEMAPDAARQVPVAVSASSILAPRPDPSHPNIPPSAAEVGAASPVLVVCKILVTAEGAIGDISVVRSSGQKPTDVAVSAYVGAHWRFLPATLNGVPIQYWTTVAIPVSQQAED